MKINEIIEYVDNIKPNHYSQEMKVSWLSDLDSMIKKEIIDTHEGAEKVNFEKYTVQTPLTTKLLVEEPYSTIYRFYLEAQIDLANGEIDKYNNSVILYNNELEKFKNYHNRNNMPLQTNIKFYRG